MTRRSITAVLGLLLVALFVIVDASAVAADDMSGGGSAPIVISADGPCITDGDGHCGQVTVTSHRSFSVASAGPAVVVTAVSYRIFENNTTNLPIADAPRSIEESTIAADTVPYDRTIDGATYYDWPTGQQEPSCLIIPYPCMVSFG